MNRRTDRQNCYINIARQLCWRAIKNVTLFTSLWFSQTLTNFYNTWHTTYRANLQRNNPRYCCCTTLGKDYFDCCIFQQDIRHLAPAGACTSDDRASSMKLCQFIHPALGPQIALQASVDETGSRFEQLLWNFGFRLKRRLVVWINHSERKGWW